MLGLKRPPEVNEAMLALCTTQIEMQLAEGLIPRTQAEDPRYLEYLLGATWLTLKLLGLGLDHQLASEVTEAVCATALTSQALDSERFEPWSIFREAYMLRSMGQRSVTPSAN